RLGETEGYAVNLSWHPGTFDGSFDVEFVDPNAALITSTGSGRALRSQVSEHSVREAYANDPWGSSLRQELAARLHSYLQQRLPSYMLPSAITVLDEMPLTENGKVNRQALAATRAHHAPQDLDSEPRTPMEETLSDIWKQILSIEYIGVEDNFFELGGHS